MEFDEKELSIIASALYNEIKRISTYSDTEEMEKLLDKVIKIKYSKM